MVSGCARSPSRSYVPISRELAVGESRCDLFGCGAVRGRAWRSAGVSAPVAELPAPPVASGL